MFDYGGRVCPKILHTFQLFRNLFEPPRRRIFDSTGYAASKLESCLPGHVGLLGLWRTLPSIE